MNTRKLAVLAFAALLTVPTMAAAFSSNSSSFVRAVEGHSVLVVMEKRAVLEGFDIAILIREKNIGPNVLWFNDKYKTYLDQERTPCKGWVLATWAGVPASTLASTLSGASLGGYTYVESYSIDIPADVTITGVITDLFYVYVGTAAPGTKVIPVWVSSVRNSQVDDDNSVCAPYTTTILPAGSTSPFVVEHNADIFGLWRDVIPTGVAIHPLGLCTTLPASCSNTTAGNSHPYNPTFATPAATHIHETALLDVYYLPVTCSATVTSGCLPSALLPPAARVFNAQVAAAAAGVGTIHTHP